MKYLVRMWDKRHDMQVVVERTFEEIVANPYGIFTNDISYILLLELRNQRGLEPLAADIGKVFGEYNG